MANQAAAINAELYGYLVTGNVSGFHQLVSSKLFNVYELECPRDKSNVLHIAASWGKAKLVADLLSHWPDLVVRANSKGDLAIHSGLKAGRLDLVEALNTKVDTTTRADQVYGWKNEEGNTALHIALENDQQEMARCLVELYPQACYLMNENGICPLYLAVTMEFPHLVLHMLDKLQPFKEEVIRALREGKPVVHAAISTSSNASLGLLEQILEKYPELIETVDEEGRTPLSYVAYMGDLVKTQHLRSSFPDSIFQRDRDEDGSFPIHQAVKGGHINIVEELFISKSLSNARGQNILHVAAQSGDANLVTYLLNNPNVDTSLINQRDEDGNTPLHLATLAKHPEVVDILTRDERVKVGLTNKGGLKVGDLVKKQQVTTSMLVDPKQDADSRLTSILLDMDTARRVRQSFVIDNELYEFLISRNINEVIQNASSKGVRLEDLECPEKKSNVLHIAASMDRHQLIGDLLGKYGCGRLMTQVNDNGDLPIHSAAKAGNLCALKTLLESRGDHIPNDICLRSDTNGNTALHIAIRNRQGEMASYLSGRCLTAAYVSNNDKICPLFLALQTRRDLHLFDDFIKRMIHQLSDPQIQCLLKDSQSIVNAAIGSGRIENLKTLINNAPDLIDSFDIRGRRPLSYAAYLGNKKVVKLLLTEFPNLAFKRDNDEDRSFPIHHASKGGHVDIIKLFRPTNTMLFLNGKRQNILHVAAKTGTHAMVAFLLKMQEFKQLINFPDEGGNTPLHLATKGLYVKAVYVLAKEVQLTPLVVNDDNLTPRELLHSRLPLEDEKFFITWNTIDKILISISNSIWVSWGASYKAYQDINKKKMMKGKAAENEVTTWSSRREYYLVVGTLIVTVTFATCVSSVPGGYDDKSGQATLANLWMFQALMLSNTLAFSMSLLFVVANIAAIPSVHSDPLGLLIVAAIFSMSVIFVLAYLSTAVAKGALGYLSAVICFLALCPYVFFNTWWFLPDVFGDGRFSNIRRFIQDSSFIWIKLLCPEPNIPDIE